MSGRDLRKLFDAGSIEEIVAAVNGTLKWATGMNMEETRDAANRIGRAISDAVCLYSEMEAPLIIYALKNQIELTEKCVPGAREAASVYDLIFRREEKVNQIKPERFVILPEKGGKA